jgi:hypothetical protein
VQYKAVHRITSRGVNDKLIIQLNIKKTGSQN